MKIVTRKISDLKPAEYNPRQMTEDQDKDLEMSLKTFGFVDPAIINKHEDRMDIIIGGHQRTRKWSEMGNDTVPTIEVNLTYDQERELNIRLNRGGEWDWDMLGNHFDEIELMEWGFSAKELEFMDPDDKDDRVAPKIDVTHTCPECGHEFSDKKETSE